MRHLLTALILLGGFLARPAAGQFALPKFDEEKIAAAGIRKVEGKQLVLYTDLPKAVEIDALPQVFDAAVPLWCAYFGIPLLPLGEGRGEGAANRSGQNPLPNPLPKGEGIREWKIAGCVIQDNERFLRCGLLPADLPEFLHGFTRGSQLWLNEQPSGYYRRHLLLHEGTHAFMARWLGGAGPPWYMEGIAELLATHRWQKGQLTLDVMPQSKEEMPYWGRIKLVKEENAAGRGMTLEEIMRYDATAHRRNEPYAWCWAATAFLDRHPLTQAAFRELKTSVKDRSPDFSLRLVEKLKKDWPAITEDWQLFVADCDYGYDIARAAVVRKPAAMLPADGGKATIAADRGWQSTGMRLEAGKTYTLTAAGRYVVGKVPKPWICEPGGVTIRYYHGQPLGKLLAALSDLEGEPTTTPLAQPQPIGMGGELSPGRTGTLYLKINESASGLADNSGTLEVTVRLMP